MPNISNILPLMLFGYLIGSIPFGLLISKIKGIDIRKAGSGNIGATNVFRILGAPFGITVFLLDLLKGMLPVLLAISFFQFPLISILTGICAILGHTFPIYLKFKGGRGSATGLGVLLAITPDLFLITLILVIIIIAITRYVSVASIICPIILSIMMFLFHKPIEYAILTSLVTILIILKHIPNIKRLLAHQESKIF